jgi:hypothetical protein
MHDHVERAESLCKHCGRRIYLLSAGGFYWVTDHYREATRYCGSDPDFPERVHAPKGPVK